MLSDALIAVVCALLCWQIYEVISWAVYHEQVSAERRAEYASIREAKMIRNPPTTPLRYGVNTSPDIPGYPPRSRVVCDPPRDHVMRSVLCCPNPKCPAVEFSSAGSVCPKCGSKLVPADSRIPICQKQSSKSQPLQKR